GNEESCAAGAVLETLDLPRDDDRRAVGPSPAVLVLDAAPGEDGGAHGLGVLRHGEDVPERASPNRLVVGDSARDDQRVVEANDTPGKDEHDVERGRRVNDRCDEVPFARTLV